jgi:hypothetical protein
MFWTLSAVFKRYVTERLNVLCCRVVMVLFF